MYIKRDKNKEITYVNRFLYTYKHNLYQYIRIQKFIEICRLKNVLCNYLQLKIICRHENIY